MLGERCNPLPPSIASGWMDEVAIQCCLSDPWTIDLTLPLAVPGYAAAPQALVPRHRPSPETPVSEGRVFRQRHIQPKTDSFRPEDRCLVNAASLPKWLQDPAGAGVAARTAPVPSSLGGGRAVLCR